MTLPPMVHRIASVLDHPSAFMGGPSQHNIRLARKVLQEIREWVPVVRESGLKVHQLVGSPEDIWRLMIDAALCDSNSDPQGEKPQALSGEAIAERR
jgi:hypothetical protein